MGILDIPVKTRKASNRKITKYFLKKHRFYVDHWGGPHDRLLDTSIFYEALYNPWVGIISGFEEDHIAIATIKYFPEDFNGYTTIGKTWGRGNVAGKLVIAYEDRTWEDTEFYNECKIFDCKTQKDFMDAIDCFNIDLIRKGYEPIRY